jgi:hypothetical protein
MNNKSIVIGLVSYGKDRYCENDIPSVNTRVTSFLDWIREHSPDFSVESLVPSDQTLKPNQSKIPVEALLPSDHILKPSKPAVSIPKALFWFIKDIFS